MTSTTDDDDAQFARLLARVAAAPPLVVPEFFVGRQVGKYIIRRSIGRGGMGVVLLAHDEELDRPVALKALVGTLPNDDALAREARALAAVNHPHVAEVYEIVRDGDHAFVVMEYCSGGTLADRIAGLDPETGRRVLRQVAEGLAEAHRKGIVHRDIKPNNIVFTSADVPKIADFGIAALTGSSPFVAGTPRYMAPELAASNIRVGPTADVFAFGRILQEWDEARPRRGLDADVLKLAAACTHPSPDLRPPDGDALVLALASRPRLPSRRLAVAAACGLFAVAAAVLLSQAPDRRPSVPILSDHPLHQKRFARAVDDFMQGREQSALNELDDLISAGVNDAAVSTLRLALGARTLPDETRHRLARDAGRPRVLVDAVRIDSPPPPSPPPSRPVDPRLADFTDAPPPAQTSPYPLLVDARLEPTLERRVQMVAERLDERGGDIPQAALTRSRAHRRLGDLPAALRALEASSGPKTGSPRARRIQMQLLIAEQKGGADAVSALDNHVQAAPLVFPLRAAALHARRRVRGVAHVIDDVEALVALGLFSGDAAHLSTEFAAIADDEGDVETAGRLYNNALAAFIAQRRFDSALALLHYRITGALIMRDEEAARQMMRALDEVMEAHDIRGPWRDIGSADRMAAAGWLDARTAGDGLVAAPLRSLSESHFVAPFRRAVLVAIIDTERRLRDSTTFTDIVPPPALVDAFPRAVGARWALAGARTARGRTSAIRRAGDVLDDPTMGAPGVCVSHDYGFVRPCAVYIAHLALALAEATTNKTRMSALNHFARQWPSATGPVAKRAQRLASALSSTSSDDHTESQKQ